MKFIKPKRAKLLIASMFFVLVVAGLYYVIYTWSTSLKETSSDAIKTASIGQIAISGEMLKQLLDHPEDIGSVAYQSLDSRLVDLSKKVDDIHSAYIYTYKMQKLNIIIDGENSEYYRNIRQNDINQNVEYREPFRTKAPHVTQPITDQFGTWVNVLVPILNEKGEVVAVFALMYPQKDWLTHAASATGKSAFVVLILLLLVVIFYRFLKRQDQKILQQEIDKNSTLKQEMEIKDGLFFTLTHEFKTPLSIINSSLQTLDYVCGNEISEKMRKYLYYIKMNSNRQLRLVTNLLDITRINAGHLSVNLESIDIVNYTNSIVNSIAVIAEQREIGLSFSSTMGARMILTDIEKYERIILNLVSNALKFTPKGKSISVNMAEQAFNGKAYVATQVCDNGIGIPEDKKDRIFQKFGLVESSLTKNAEGTGIGLYLVKMLTDLIGGIVYFESEFGIGSKFTVLLPLTDAPAEQAEVLKDSSEIEKAVEIELSDISL